MVSACSDGGKVYVVPSHWPRIRDAQEQAASTTDLRTAVWPVGIGTLANEVEFTITLVVESTNQRTSPGGFNCADAGPAPRTNSAMTVKIRLAAIGARRVTRQSIIASSFLIRPAWSNCAIVFGVCIAQCSRKVFVEGCRQDCKASYRYATSVPIIRSNAATFTGSRGGVMSFTLSMPAYHSCRASGTSLRSSVARTEFDCYGLGWFGSVPRSE